MLSEHGFRGVDMGSTCYVRGVDGDPPAGWEDLEDPPG